MFSIDSLIMYLKFNDVSGALITPNSTLVSGNPDESLFNVSMPDEAGIQAAKDQLDRDIDHPVIMLGIQVYSRIVSMTDKTLVVGIIKK
ncbi:hypothetical protein JCM15765_39910 [Paradesulfitobacterium aromaticivorans]